MPSLSTMFAHTERLEETGYTHTRNTFYDNLRNNIRAHLDDNIITKYPLRDPHGFSTAVLQELEGLEKQNKLHLAEYAPLREQIRFNNIDWLAQPYLDRKSVV